MSHTKLIVQLPFMESSDYDSLIVVEESLIKAFTQRNPFGEVDGHDVGQGRFNIYIKPKGSWGPVVERVEAVLKLRGVLKDAVIVKQLKSGAYSVAWPRDYHSTFEL